MRCYHQWGWTTATFKISELSSGRGAGWPETESLCLETNITNSPSEIQQEVEVWKMPGVYKKGIYLLIWEHIPEGEGSFGGLFKNQRAGRQHFPPEAQPTYIGTRKAWTLDLLADSMPNTHVLLWMFLCNRPLAGVQSKQLHCLASCKQTRQASKVTPAPGRKEENHTHQFDYSHSSWLGADICSDGRPCTPTKASQGMAQGDQTVVQCSHSSSKSWPNWNPRQPQTGLFTTQEQTLTTIGKEMHCR